MDKVIEVDDKKLYLVKAYQSIEDFVFYKAREILDKAVDEALTTGSLSSLLGIDIVTTTILPGRIFYVSMECWDVSLEEALINVTAKVPLEYEDGDGIHGDYFGLKLLLSCFFYADHEEFEVEKVGLWDRCIGSDGLLMDRWLNPLANLGEFWGDAEAQQFWEELLCKTPQKLEEMTFAEAAEKLGLELRYDLAGDHMGGKGKIPAVLSLKDKAIYLNMLNRRVIHERVQKIIITKCLIYRFFYKAMRLQGMEDDQFSQIKEVYVEEQQAMQYKTLPGDFLKTVEFRCFAYKVMMPLILTKEAVNRHLQAVEVFVPEGFEAHEPAHLEEVIKSLAKEYEFLDPYDIKSRLRQLGFKSVCWSYNCVDGKWLRAFDAALEKDKTYFLDRWSVFNLWKKNKAFRELAEENLFLYANGHLVRSLPDCYEVKGAFGACVTGKVNSRADRYCVRLTGKYNEDTERYEVRFSDEDEEVTRSRLCSLKGSAIERDAREASMKSLEKYSGSLSSMMKLINKERKPIRRLLPKEAEDQEDFSEGALLRFCLTYGLEPDLSFLLFEKAGISLADDSPLRPILTLFYLDDMDILMKVVDEKMELGVFGRRPV